MHSPFRLKFYKQQYAKWCLPRQSSTEFKVIGHPLAYVHPPFSESGYRPDYNMPFRVKQLTAYVN